MTEDVQSVVSLDLPWEKLRGKSLFISGASGLLGKFLVDVLVARNATAKLGCKVVVVRRNKTKARTRFADYLDTRHRHLPNLSA